MTQTKETIQTLKDTVNIIVNVGSVEINFKSIHLVAK